MRLPAEDHNSFSTLTWLGFLKVIIILWQIAYVHYSNYFAVMPRYHLPVSVKALALTTAGVHSQAKNKTWSLKNASIKPKIKSRIPMDYSWPWILTIRLIKDRTTLQWFFIAPLIVHQNRCKHIVLSFWGSLPHLPWLLNSRPRIINCYG